MTDASVQNIAIGAISVLLGFLGAEGATPALYERLLWPQRAYMSFSWRHVPTFMFLLPDGGPNYKAAIQVLDTFRKSGLFRGAGRGNMLGTAFFPESSTKYTMRSDDSEVPSHSDLTRNCLWERVVSMVPMGVLLESRSAKKGPARTSRTSIAVHHLVLEVTTEATNEQAMVSIDHEHERLTWNTIAGTISTELLGICVAIFVAAKWQSYLAVLWILPLIVRCLSALACLDRQILEIPTQADTSMDFEMDMSPDKSSLLVITGPPSLVLQFFRHYGHPERDRIREVAQLSLVVVSALLFPIGLIISVTIMPVEIQLIWTSYQMYLVCVMFVTRYLSPNLWASLEEAIAHRLSTSTGKVVIWSRTASSAAIRADVIKAELISTEHDSVSDAKSHHSKLLSRYHA